jgi:hypothetical protein
LFCFKTKKLKSARLAKAAMQSNFILACHLTGIYDVNRNTVLPGDDFNLVQDWVQSIAALQLKAVLFHNNFSDDTCAKYEGEFLKFIKVSYTGGFNPNVYRYFMYDDFLRKNLTKIGNLFVTDITDVVVVNNPFIQAQFRINNNRLFCGDEPQVLNNEWMNAHSAHLRKSIIDFESYERTFKDSTLLNCGIIGGNIQVMRKLISGLCYIHNTYNQDNNTAYTGDMGAFNYLVRTSFNDQLLHGYPVNTIFKSYETSRQDCWFRHK